MNKVLNKKLLKEGNINNNFLIKALKDNKYLYLLLLLPFLHLMIFKYVPMLGNVIAFRRYSPGGPLLGKEWRGLYYFKLAVEDPVFWQAFRNTFLISFLDLTINFPIPIIFALLLNEVRITSLKRVVQTISYLPRFLSAVVIVGIIQGLLSPSTGIINNVIEFIGLQKINFLMEADWFRTIYIGSNVWQWTGWNAIIYIAALTGIDPHLYEAARVDGANRLQQIRYITLPGIMPTVIIMLILRVGHILNLGFEKILLLMNPGTQEVADVIQTFVYRMGIVWSNYSYSTAVGLFKGLIGLTLILIVNKFARKFSETSLW